MTYKQYEVISDVKLYDVNPLNGVGDKTKITAPRE